MIRYWFRCGLIILVVTILILMPWIGIGHSMEAPPRLLYGDLQFRSLRVWDTDCGSILSVCQHERVLLTGLWLHPVAQESPDGEYIAVYMMDGWMIYRTDCLLEGETCDSSPLDPLTADVRLAWKPDGSAVGYFSGNPGTILSIRRRGCWDSISALDCYAAVIPLGGDRVFREPAWSADGTQLAFVGLIPCGLYVMDASCLDSPDSCTEAYRLIAVSNASPHWPSFSPDGRQILYYEETPSGAQQLFIVDLETLDVRQITVNGSSHIPAWSGDGRYIAYSGFENLPDGDTDIYILDLERQITVQVVTEPGTDFNYPSWSPRR